MKLGFINVVDLECSHDDAGKCCEIIEIGIVKYWPKDGLITDKRSIVIRPVYSKITPFIQGLTGWTQEAVDQGVSYPEACEILRTEYQSRDHIWMSYGEFDRNMFIKCSSMFKEGYIFGNSHINCKPVAAALLGLPKELGLGKVLTKVGLEFKGRAHNGADDAENVARLWQFLSI